MTTPRRRAPCALAFILGTLGLALAAEPALAHAHLTSATPAVGSTVAAAPTALGLTFTEGVNLAFTGVTVTGDRKQPVGTGVPMHGPGGDATLVVPLKSPLSAGIYTVDWHALASDGHKTAGRYTFTITP